MKFIINSKQVRANAVEAVSRIKGEDNLEVIIRKHKKSKTDQQRSFWHLLLSELGEETGYTLGEVKTLVKKAVTGSETVAIGSTHIEVVPSSEKADRELYGAYIEATYKLAAEIGLQLPSPRGFIDES